MQFHSVSNVAYQVKAVLLPTQHLPNDLRKEGPWNWALESTWEIQITVLALGFFLAQSWLHSSGM